MKTIYEQTLASLVKENYRVVPVLEKYNLDFCCRGKKSLQDACLEKGLELSGVAAELEAAVIAPGTNRMSFEKMSAEQLISHILVNHHFYVKQAMPLIYMHLAKVAAKHGIHYPYMVQVLELFEKIQEEMTSHMHKEEAILFPRIKEMEKLHPENRKTEFPSNYLIAPITVMEIEHEHAGDILFKIRELTNNYTAPDDACTTFRVCLSELKEFEDDLHEHVHLENNILFPQAQRSQI
jgi:regulator of cell morphogenesis and NO signaling